MMANTAFSPVKRMFDGNVSATGFQIGKRDGYESIAVHPV